MTEVYQVINFQHQLVMSFKGRHDAINHVKSLRERFPDEGFYVVELSVVYSSGDIQ